MTRRSGTNSSRCWPRPTCSWRRGTRRRRRAALGLGPDDLRPVNPGLVTCAITGFGRDGPLPRRRRPRSPGACTGGHHGRAGRPPRGPDLRRAAPGRPRRGLPGLPRHAGRPLPPVLRRRRPACRHVAARRCAGLPLHALERVRRIGGRPGGPGSQWSGAEFHGRHPARHPLLRLQRRSVHRHPHGRASAPSGA